MRFDSTILKNFRNFCGPDLKFNWEPGINLILGKNGTGKTNLLEALSILTGWGAFAKTSSLIPWSTNEKPYIFAKVSGEESITVSAEVSTRISLRLGGKSVSFTDLRLSFPSIIFLTGNLSLIDGSPSSRRLFVDRLCALFVPPFAKRLADFKTVSRARSLLLRQGKATDPADESYFRLGGWVMDIRREVVKQLMTMMTDKRVTLKFLPEIEESSSSEKFLRTMTASHKTREIYAQRSLFGPGNDELLISVAENGRPASESLSRGQKRRLILYMIITAGRMIEARLGRKPVLLLDDMTAELDAEGRNLVFNELEVTGWQVFITAPENPFAKTKKRKGTRGVVML